MIDPRSTSCMFEGEVYFVAPVDGGVIKIGFAKNTKARLSGLNCSSPVRLVALASAPGRRFDESAVQNRFIEHHSHGEWFHPCDDLLALIAQIVQTGALPNDLLGDKHTRCLVKHGRTGVRWNEAQRANASQSQKARWAVRRAA